MRTATVTAPPVSATPLRRRSWTAAVAPAAGAVAAVAVMATMRRAIPDDGFITLGYARELAAGHHWGMLPGLDANTATSPLNVWLLAGGYLLVGDRPAAVVGVVLAVALAAVAWCVSRLAVRGGPLAGVLSVAVLASSPLMVSTVGLETYLAAAVLAGLAVACRAGRWPPAGLLLGLAVLTRPDLAVPALTLVAGLLPWRRWAATLAVGAAVALPWHLWSWLHLGGFVPDTFFLKVGESAWEGYRFADGVGLYWRDFPAATALTVAVALAALVAAVVARRRLPVTLVVAAAAHWSAMAVLDPSPYAWYMCPAFCLCAFAVAVTLADTRSAGLRRTGVGAVALVVAASAVLVAGRPDPQVGPVVYNWASSAQYQAAGPEIARLAAGDPVDADVEIGALAWSCGCQLRNMFTDRAVTDQVTKQRLADAGPTMRTLMGWNFAHRTRAALPAYRWRVGGTGADVAPIPGRRWVWPTYSPAHGANSFMLERVGPTG